VVGVVEEDAAGAERTDVGVVAVLVKGDEHVGAVAGRENVAGAHADLEDRRSARDRGRNRHVGHDVLIAATGEAGEEAADGLDAVLRVAGEADDDVVNRAGSVGSGGAVSGDFGVIGADPGVDLSGEAGLEDAEKMNWKRTGETLAQ
jgi:hypothetical protein